MKRITEVAAKLGFSEDDLESYGRLQGENFAEGDREAQGQTNGKLVLVTAISPARGEGKTTTTVGLGDALNQLGKKTVICLREPALGPVVRRQGGAPVGGYSQVVPMGGTSTFISR